MQQRHRLDDQHNTSLLRVIISQILKFWSKYKSNERTKNSHNQRLKSAQFGQQESQPKAKNKQNKAQKHMATDRR